MVEELVGKSVEEEDTNHFLSVFLLISAAIAFAIMWQTFLNN